MDSVFDMSNWWVWLVQVVATIISIIMYSNTDGRELVYAMYIPMDIMLNSFTIVFFWLYYWIDKSNQEDSIRVANRLIRMDNKKMSIEEPFFSNDNSAYSDNSHDFSPGNAYNTLKIVRKKSSIKLARR